MCTGMSFGCAIARRVSFPLMLSLDDSAVSLAIRRSFVKVTATPGGPATIEWYPI
jgi:hypothetical protein